MFLRPLLEAEYFVDEDDGDTPRCDLPIDDNNLVHGAAYAIRRLGAGVFEGVGVLVDAEQTLLEVGDDLIDAASSDPPRTSDKLALANT